MRARCFLVFLTCVFLLGGLLALAQGGPSPAELEGILKETGADKVIEDLGRVLVGWEAIDEQVLALGVALEVAAELEEYQGLAVADWFEENMDRELSKAELNWIGLVKTGLRNGHPQVYDSLKEALLNLATEPVEQPEQQPETQPGGDLGEVIALLQGFSQRLTDLEERVTGLTQGEEEEETATAEELASLQQEIEVLKEGLPDRELLAELSEALPQITALESKVSRLSRSMAWQRGLTIFLIILVILLLVWLVFLRMREMSRTV